MSSSSSQQSTTTSNDLAPQISTLLDSTTTPIDLSSLSWETKSRSSQIVSQPIDNLSRWFYYLADIESPDLFKEWGFYYLLSACIQRKIWLGSLDDAIFPNLYVILVAPPGIGKGRVIYKVMEAIRVLPYIRDEKGQVTHNKNLNIVTGADSTTLEALTLKLYRHTSCVRYTILNPKTNEKRPALYAHASMAFMIEELATLFRENTKDLVRFFNKCWDCKDYEKETKFHGNDIIKNVFLTMLAGTQPDHIQEIFDSSLLNSGFSARTLFAFETTTAFRKFSITYNDQQQVVYSELLNHLRKIAVAFGPVHFSKEAYEFLEHWYERDFEATVYNKSDSLKHYYGRKKVHVMKLAILMHFADKLDFTIEKEDCVKALDLLRRTEEKMHLAISYIRDITGEGRAAQGVMDFLMVSGQEMPFEKILLHFYKTMGTEKLLGHLNTLVTTGHVVRNGKMFKYVGEKRNGG